jgi:putative spermidine/putrescine transport system ATP-binding protein/putrescine transport system ATP-binding protein
MAVVELHEVTKSFGAVAALKGISFDVEKGRVISLLGPSGCGKTTTLRLIAGFDDPDDGTITISGRPMVGLRPYQRNVGLVFQDYALFPHMNVSENISYGMRFRGVARNEIERQTERYLALVRLGQLADRYPRQLSGGQQQRVALARALATRPEVMLLDEPLSALDAKLRLELRIELKSILSETGSTTIIVTHDQEEAMSLADEVVVMNGGAIEQRGTPVEIYAAPRTRFVAEFVGRSNWFAGELEGTCDSGYRLFRTEDGIEFRVPATDHESGPRQLCLRPERIELEPGETTALLPDANRLMARVRGIEHLGADLTLYLEIAGGRRIIAILRNLGQPVVPDESLWIRFRPIDCILLPL